MSGPLAGLRVLDIATIIAAPFAAMPRFTVDRAEVRHAAGDVGQDNHEVFTQWLGLSEDQIAELAQAKVI